MDGSNLPWVVNDLQQRHRDRFDEWLADRRQLTFPISVN
jgi:hypothetical protein